MKKDTVSLVLQVSIILILSYSIYIQTIQTNYWKDRCDALKKEYSNKIAEIQTSLNIFVKKIEILEKENKALSELKSYIAEIEPEFVFDEWE